MEILNELLSGVLQSGGFGGIFLAYAAGVLVSATPCVYPMIPITLGTIGAHAEESKMRGFLLSIMYVAGLALVYSGLGLIAAATGMMFGQISTSPWAYLLVANLCLLYGVLMMDWISLPRFSLLSGGFAGKGNGFFSVFVMGAVSGLVAAPCTAPALAILLTYVVTTRNLVYGALLLFAFAYGMGTLLILLGTFVGLAKTLPRSGNWLIWIKRSLALIMLLAGEYFLVQAGKLLF